MSKKTYATAIRDVIAEEMRRDENVFVMGEDIELLGGIFGCTRDLYKEFGTDRIRNTPISEAAMIGAGVGAACAGMRPIVELMYMDFTLVAADQIINQAAKTRYIFGGKAKIPLVSGDNRELAGVTPPPIVRVWKLFLCTSLGLRLPVLLMPLMPLVC
jgi:pyruvate dehydrogenase E1 component beta subunit